MSEMVGTLMLNFSATRDCAMAASSREKRWAISTSVFARLIALLNSSTALSRLPLKRRRQRAWSNSRRLVTANETSLHQVSPHREMGNEMGNRSNPRCKHIKFYIFNINITREHRLINVPVDVLTFVLQSCRVSRKQTRTCCRL